MKVIAPDDLSFVTALERPVDKGEEVEVDEELGAALLEQGWKAARGSKRVSAGNGSEDPDASSSTPTEE